MMPSRFRRALFSFLYCWPVIANAITDQSGFPAACSIYAACDASGSCIRVHLPSTAMVILQTKDGSLEVVSFDQKNRRKLGFFPTLEDAHVHFGAKVHGDFGSFIIPNFEVADAVGFDVYRTSTIERGFTFEKTKVVCAKVKLPSKGNL